MSDAVFHPSRAPVAIPIRQILPWAVLCGLLCLIAISLAAGAFGTALTRMLASTRGAFDANLSGFALFAVIVAAAIWFMPAVDEVPERFSAMLLWRFRLTSLGMQAVIWATVGLGFGALARPVLEGRRPKPATAVVPTVAR